MKNVFIGFLLSIVALAGSAAEKLTIASPVQRDNPTVKREFDLFEKALNILGYVMEVRVLPDERTIIETDTGEVDGLVAKGEEIGKLYDNIVMVDEPVIFLGYYAFALKKHELKSIEDIVASDLKVINVFGVKYIQDRLAFVLPRERYYDAPNVESGIRMVEHGRGDIFVSTIPPTYPVLKDNAHPRIVRSDKPFATRFLYPFMHIKHKRLAEKIAIEMRRLKKESAQNP